MFGHGHNQSLFSEEDGTSKDMITPFPLPEGEQNIWPWSQPVPFLPDEEGTCMDMITPFP